MIKILYFARLREELGCGSEMLELGPGDDSLGALISRLSQRGGAWGETFGGGQFLMSAVNQEVAGREAPIRDGDEIAFFPPVTGG